jgi:hypothetical protein
VTAAAFYQHPTLGYARRTPRAGWRPLFVVTAFSSKPSSAADEKARSRLGVEAEAQFVRCSIGGEIVHVSDLESAGHRGSHGYCRKHGAQRRRENRLKAKSA